MRGRWISHVFSVELRKAFAYRADFWVQVVASVLVELSIAYFLWHAVFEQSGATSMGGYTLPAMMLYYLLGSMTNKVLVGPEYGFMSNEIYDGSLTRYLVYPVPYFVYKFAAYFAKSSVALFQMLFMLTAFVALVGLPEGTEVSSVSILMGLVAVSFSTLLYFSIASILEMVSFWADNVWSLMVMLRFSTAILGGGLLPLSLFPAWAQTWLSFLPFRFLISFPVKTMMGQVSPGEWAIGLSGAFAWSMVFLSVGGLVWKRGTIQYSGVGA
jgi:ABC-2 type transport system permease protein